LAQKIRILEEQLREQAPGFRNLKAMHEESRLLSEYINELELLKRLSSVHGIPHWKLQRKGVV
jgi:hypothetical protein